MMYVLLVVGFVLLIKGADWFVDGSSSLAKAMKIPTVIIGLTIVALGTSAPEEAVSISAALSGNNDIALSNVIGSNLFNMLMVVGICAIIKPFVTNKQILKQDLPINIIASVALLLIIIDGSINRVEGIILLVGMISYMLLMIYSAKKEKGQSDDEEIKSLPLWQSLLFIGIGLAAIIVGGNLVVDNATTIALSLGLSQNFVGLTIVAIGTSLPELVTSIVATRKNQSGLALGNAVGSSIFNIVFILGTTAAIRPLSVIHDSMIDCGILIAVGVMMFIFGKTKGKFSRVEGIICVLIYVAYTAYLFIR